MVLTWEPGNWSFYTAIQTLYEGSLLQSITITATLFDIEIDYIPGAWSERLHFAECKKSHFQQSNSF